MNLRINMSLKKSLFFIPLCFQLVNAIAQPSEYRMSREEYIEKYKDDAIKEMLMHKVPASITLAQAILESANGNSPLAMYANNHFGIKCKTEWTGLTFTLDDDEKNECFRKYSSVLESYADHSLFLRSRSWYAPLFELKITDYKGWAYGLKEAGYATHPDYAKMLINLIEKYELYQYDIHSQLPAISSASKPTKLPKTQPVTRPIEYRNYRKFTVAGKNDSFYKIANDFDISLYRLFLYNDLDKDAEIFPGQVIYIQPKRKKAKEEFHIVQKGETMYAISQQHGIKLKELYAKNLMQPAQEPKPGEKLWLRKTKK
jgi:LysM repeat protein